MIGLPIHPRFDAWFRALRTAGWSWLDIVDGYGLAIADTHPQGGDAKQAPFMSGGGAEGNRPKGAQC